MIPQAAGLSRSEFHRIWPKYTRFYLRNNRASFPAYQTGDEFIKPGNKGEDWFIGIS